MLDVVGCCASYHTTSSTEVVLDSCNYHLACIGGDDIAEGNCDEACQSNDMILKWYRVPRELVDSETDGSSVRTLQLLPPGVTHIPIRIGASTAMPVERWTTSMFK